MIINNKEVSPLGFGTWKMGGTHEEITSNDKADIAAIRYALAQGITFINGAEVYGNGHTDELIGEAADGFPDSILASKLKRETLLASDTIEAATTSIARCFRRVAVDLLYVHWPFPGTDMKAYLSAMFSLVDKGLVGAIGVSNFDLTQLRDAMAIAQAHGHRIAAIENVYSLLNRGGGIHPAVNLIQPGFDVELQQYCRDNDVIMIAYTPLAKGLVRDNPVVQRIAAAHQASPTQIALAWIMAQNIVPIVKSSQPVHIDDNLGALNVMLDASEMQQLQVIA